MAKTHASKKPRVGRFSDSMLDLRVTLVKAQTTLSDACRELNIPPDACHLAFWRDAHSGNGAKYRDQVMTYLYARIVRLHQPFNIPTYETGEQE